MRYTLKAVPALLYWTAFVSLAVSYGWKLPLFVSIMMLAVAIERVTEKL